MNISAKTELNTLSLALDGMSLWDILDGASTLTQAQEERLEFLRAWSTAASASLSPEDRQWAVYEGDWRLLMADLVAFNLDSTEDEAIVLRGLKLLKDFMSFMSTHENESWVDSTTGLTAKEWVKLALSKGFVIPA